MSIINDALKKVGGGRQKTNWVYRGPAPTRRNTPKPEPSVATRAAGTRRQPGGVWNNNRWRALGGIMLICGFVILVSEVTRRTGPNEGDLNPATEGRLGGIALMRASSGTPIPEFFPPGTFRVTGIVWDPTRPYAFINNQVVEPGDAVGGATVKEIREEQVVLETDNGLVVLDLL